MESLGEMVTLVQADAPTDFLARAGATVGALEMPDAFWRIGQDQDGTVFLKARGAAAQCGVPSMAILMNMAWAIQRSGLTVQWQDGQKGKFTPRLVIAETIPPCDN
jgi:hypothetical protein